MREQVAAVFDGYINRKLGAMPDVCRFLLNHERKGTCIDRTVEQIRKAEGACNIGGRFDTERFRLLIETAAAMFCNLALTHAGEAALSHAERVRRIADADKMKRAEEAVADLEREATTSRLTSLPGGVCQ
jgi:hypothetical protein